VLTTTLETTERKKYGDRITRKQIIVTKSNESGVILCVISILNYVHVLQLQQAVDALVAWANEWQLSISVNKCCVLNVAVKSLIVVVSVLTV